MATRVQDRTVSWSTPWRSLPSGQDEPYGPRVPSSNRSWKVFVPVSWSRKHPSAPRRLASGVEAESDTIEQSQPYVATAIMGVRAGD
jgi:hypothetical protein